MDDEDDGQELPTHDRDELIRTLRMAAATGGATLKLSSDGLSSIVQMLKTSPGKQASESKADRLPTLMSQEELDRANKTPGIVGILWLTKPRMSAFTAAAWMVVTALASHPGRWYLVAAMAAYIVAGIGTPLLKWVVERRLRGPR